MTDESNRHRHRWAPEWIAVLTLAVAILALGGGMFASLNAMEERIRDDMRAMESRIREDLRELRGDVGMLPERAAGIDEQVSRLDERVSRLDERVSRLDDRISHLDERVSRLDERVSRLEVRFDQEFPPRSASDPSSAIGRASPPQNVRL